MRQRLAPVGGDAVVPRDPDPEADVLVPGASAVERPVDQHGGAAPTARGLDARAVVSSSSALCWIQSGDVGRGSPAQSGFGVCNEIETAGRLCTHPLDDELFAMATGVLADDTYGLLRSLTGWCLRNEL